MEKDFLQPALKILIENLRGRQVNQNSTIDGYCSAPKPLVISSYQ